MTELGPIFARLGIAQYLGSFLAEGFETWETVLDITESDLEALNVKLGHRRKLQRAIAESRAPSNDPNLNSPSRLTPSDDHRSVEPEDKSGANKGLGARGSGNAGKRKYRRHPKPDENAPERPPSAYVIFSNSIREELKGEELSFTDIAKRVGERWQVLTPEEREPFERQAAAAKDRYNAELAEYKETDSYREYAQYLADFKAKQVAQQTEGKRPKLRQMPSTNSSASGGSTTSQTAIQGLPTGRSKADSIGSNRANSAIGGYLSPPQPMLLGPSMDIDKSSPAPNPTSSLPATSDPGQALARPVNRDSAANEAAEDGYFDIPPRSQQFPRILPVEERGRRNDQVSTPASESSWDGSFPPRRSYQASPQQPPSLRHEDTSLSSISSLPSVNSAGSSGAVLPPLMSIEQGKIRRSLPPPQPSPGSGDGYSDYSDQPPLFVHPPLKAQPSVPRFGYQHPQSSPDNTPPFRSQTNEMFHPPPARLQPVSSSQDPLQDSRQPSPLAILLHAGRLAEEGKDKPP
ncbi:MAG: hypothetical protein M1819_002779 [Sarea resinae]|nr:MAG: hypothetical protein M1819_002779 [Sarea resinae]